jgi:hypothetical protein
MHPADPQTFNLYSYVANNPINAVDPTGHMSEYKMHMMNLPYDSSHMQMQGGGTTALFGGGAGGTLDQLSDTTNGGTPIFGGKSPQVAPPPTTTGGDVLNAAKAATTSPDGIRIANAEVLTDNPGNSNPGIWVSITYQLTASGKDLKVPGYVFQEDLTDRSMSKTDPDTRKITLVPNSQLLPTCDGFYNIGPTPANGMKTATDSNGRFPDAPLGATLPNLNAFSMTQNLRAIGPDGKTISFGQNRITVDGGKPGTGKITIDNKQMNIHFVKERP